jgi:Zn-dependent protease with chaperone function
VDRDELERRAGLCATTIGRICRDRGTQKEEPTLRLSHGRTEHKGFYARRVNELRVRTTSFLDDPETTDQMIEGVIAHELGHWADPDFDLRTRRSLAVCAMGFGGTVVIAGGLMGSHLLGLQLGGYSFGGVGTVLIAMLGVVPVGIAVTLLILALVDWPAEYFADRFAASVVGSQAVVALLDSLDGQSLPNPSHPSPKQRAQRVRDLARINFAS